MVTVKERKEEGRQEAREGGGRKRREEKKGKQREGGTNEGKLGKSTWDISAPFLQLPLNL